MTGFDILGPGGEFPLKPFGQKSVGGEGGAVQDGVEKGGFGEALSETLRDVKQLADDVKDKREGLAMGEPVEIHDLMIAMGKSQNAFNMMLEVRNKLLEAWSTLQRSVS